MKQIKTVYKDINPRLSPASGVQEFDDEVNAALDEGWTLVKRGVLDPHVGESYDYNRTFYAELERETVEVKQAEERNCETCAHFSQSLRKSPCCNCEDVNDVPTLWEPRT